MNVNAPLSKRVGQCHPQSLGDVSITIATTDATDPGITAQCAWPTGKEHLLIRKVSTPLVQQLL